MLSKKSFLQCVTFLKHYNNFDLNKIAQFICLLQLEKLFYIIICVPAFVLSYHSVYGYIANTTIHF